MIDGSARRRQEVGEGPATAGNTVPEKEPGKMRQILLLALRGPLSRATS